MALPYWYDGLPSATGLTKASWLDGLIAATYGTSTSTLTSNATAAIATWTAPSATVSSQVTVNGTATAALWTAVDAEAVFGSISTPATASWVAPSGVPVPGPVAVAGVQTIGSWVAPGARTVTLVAGVAAVATWTVAAATGVAGAADTPGVSTSARWIAVEANSRVLTAGSLHVTINGLEFASASIDDTPGVGILRGSLTLDDKWGEPTVCNFVTRNILVEFGQEVIVTLQQVPLRQFAGVVLSHRRSYETETFEHPKEDVTCISYAWILNEKKIIKQYLNTSATAIALDLMSDLESFTVVGVQADLPVIGQISFGNVDRMEALKQLAAAFSGSIYVDYYRDLRLFLTEAENAPEALTTTHPTLNEFSHEVDWSQAITRQYLEGGGASVLAEITPGETIIPVETTRWYEVDGATGIVDFEEPETGLDGEGFTTTSGNVQYLNAAAYAGNYGLRISMIDGALTRVMKDFDETVVASPEVPSSECVYKARAFVRFNQMPDVDHVPVFGLDWKAATTDTGMVIHSDRTFAASIYGAVGVAPTLGSGPSTATLDSGKWYEIHITAYIRNDSDPLVWGAWIWVIVAVYDETGAFVERVWSKRALTVVADGNMYGWSMGTNFRDVATGLAIFDIDEFAYAVASGIALPAETEAEAFHVTDGIIYNSQIHDSTILSPSLNMVTTGYQRIRYRGRLHSPKPGSLSADAIVATPQIGAGKTAGEHQWAVTLVTPAGETTPMGLVSASTTFLVPSAPPTAGSCLVGAGPETGVHKYAITEVTADGESTPGPLLTKSVGFTDPPNGVMDHLTLALAPGDELGLGTYKYGSYFETATGTTTVIDVGQNIHWSTIKTYDGIPAPTVAPVVTQDDYFQNVGSGNNNPGPDANVGNVVEYCYTYTYDYTAEPPRTPPSPVTTITLEVCGHPQSLGTTWNQFAQQPGPFGVLQSKGTTITVKGSTDPRCAYIWIWRRTNGENWDVKAAVPNNYAGGDVVYNSAYSYDISYRGGHTLGAGVPNGRRVMIYVPSPAYAAADVTKIHLVRTVVNGSQLKLLATINAPFPGTTEYLDQIADGALGANAPTVNTASGANKVSLIIPVGRTGVTQRRVWRTVVALDQLKLLTTLANNTTTAYVDQTVDASLGVNAPTVNTAIMNVFALSHIKTGPPEVTARRLYGTAANATQLKFLYEMANNTATEYVDSIADAALGANAPTEDLSGLPRTTTEGLVEAGATELQVVDPDAFPATGGWIIVNGQQVIRYYQVVGNMLTGIPEDGPGSITVNIPPGSTIATAPQLIGIPATGAGSVIYTIPEGEQLNTLIRYTDSAAQAAWRTMFGYLGSDGIKEDYAADNRLSLDETKRRCRAMLDLKKVPEVLISWTSRDTLTRAGKTIHVDLQDLPDLPVPTVLLGDFKIQSVQVSQFDEAPHAGLMPLYRAHASSKRFTLDDLLRLTLLGRT